MTTPTPRLLALSTAVPAYALGQEEVADRARRLFAERTAADLDRLMPVFANAGIERRYSCVPIDWYERPHGWTERNALYLENAVNLLERAARTALRNAELSPAEIDAVITISTTGIATPSLDAMLMDRLELRRDVKRMPIFGLGCVGGAAGIARAGDYVRAFPNHVAALLSVELCSLTIQKQDVSMANLISSALFGDGAAAVVVSGADRISGGPEILDTRSVFYPETEHIMGWDISEKGFQIVLSPDLPALIVEHLGRDVDEFLRDHGLTRKDIGRWILHTGGPKILEATAKALELPKGALDVSWECLRRVGNLSSTSVLLVLEEVMKRRRPAAGTYSLLAAMGPAFCSELVLLRWD